MAVKLSQLVNVRSPNESPVTLLGILIVSALAQPKKADSPTEVTPSGTTIEVIRLQEEKASSAIALTLYPFAIAGMVMAPNVDLSMAILIPFFFS